MVDIKLKHDVSVVNRLEKDILSHWEQIFLSFPTARFVSHI